MQKKNARYVEFPLISDKRGRLIFAEAARTVPFLIKRIYYICGITEKGTRRGGHAHRGVEEIIIPIAGAFEVVCDSGFMQEHFHMIRSDIGLYIPEMVWTDLFNFSPDTVCLVLSSEYYDEVNYVRKYGDFMREVKEREKR